MQKQQKQMRWTGEVAQWLRALTAITEDPGSIPKTIHSSSQLPRTPVPRDLTFSSDHCTRRVNRHMY